MKTGFYAFNPVNSALSTINSTAGVLTCTAHVLDYGPTGKTFSNAGYAAGVRIVGTDDRLGVPTELASLHRRSTPTPGARSSTRTRTYLFANDLSRGFDVYEYDPAFGAVDTRSALQKQYGVRRVGRTTFTDGAWCANPGGTKGLLMLASPRA